MAKRVDYASWEFLTGDVNWEEYGGAWCKRGSGGPDGRWWVVRSENRAEWGDGATGYYCALLLIDPEAASKSGALEAALDSCGWHIDTSTADIVNTYDGTVVAPFDHTTNTWSMVLVHALLGCGTYATMDEVSTHLVGSRWPEKLRRQMIRAGEELMANDLAVAKQLKSTANKVGATWADMLAGDSLAGLRRTSAAILRGEDVPLDPHSAIMLKTYAAADGHTLGGKCEAALAAAGRAIAPKTTTEE